MQLPEQITQNPLFMLSLLAPLAPMLVAILILTFRFVKKVASSLKARREQKRINARQKKLAKKGEIQGDILLEEAVPQSLDDILMAQAQQDAMLPVEGEEGEAQSQSPSEVSSDIMALINDVFVDDGKNERNAILLHDTEDVSAQELLVMAQDIARKMGINVSPKTS